MPFSAYHELVMELARMKREGFRAPEREPETAPPVAHLPVEIESAIQNLGVDPQTERHLRKMAWELRRAEVPDDEIAQRITTGEEVAL